jgi:hypothetical protein
MNQPTASELLPGAVQENRSVAVVIPSYKVTRHILGVIAGMGPEVTRIYVVDDCCPDKSGDFVRASCQRPARARAASMKRTRAWAAPS